MDTNHAKTIEILNRRGDVVATATVDAADHERLSAYRWRLQRAHGGRLQYAYRTHEHRPVLMHREILGLGGGRAIEVDHANGNGLDNRRSNLRPCTHALNQQNVRKCEGKTSRFRGVYWETHAKRWRAYAKIGGRRFHLGYFADEAEAGRAASVFRAARMPFSADARRAA